MTEPREFVRSHPVHNIPSYPFLLIRDEGQVFLTNKHTGEVVDTLSPLEAADLWREQWETNASFKAFYTKDYTYPKPSPDTAKDIDTLKQLCSDKTRTGRGDTGYLLDFLLRDACTVTESKLVALICTKAVVWSYCVLTWGEIVEGMGLSARQTKRVFESICTKGLIQELAIQGDFKGEDGVPTMLLKVHPKLFWKGRYSAFIAALQESYEGEEGF